MDVQVLPCGAGLKGKQGLFQLFQALCLAPEIRAQALGRGIQPLQKAAHPQIDHVQPEGPVFLKPLPVEQGEELPEAAAQRGQRLELERLQGGPVARLVGLAELPAQGAFLFQHPAHRD